MLILEKLFMSPELSPFPASKGAWEPFKKGRSALSPQQRPGLQWKVPGWMSLIKSLLALLLPSPTFPPIQSPGEQPGLHRFDLGREPDLSCPSMSVIHGT